MTKVCPNCKTENADSSRFCQDCGEELEEPINVPQENKEKRGGFGGWWNKQGKGVKAAIGIVGVCVIGLIFIIAIGGMLSPDKNQSTSSSADKTFQGSGISFNYPNSWNEYTPQTTTSESVVNLERDDPNVAILSVSEYNDSRSLTELLASETNIAESEGDVISKTSVTVDGEPGYQITWKYSTNGGGIQQNTFFVKNNIEYRIVFTGDSVSDIQSDINTVLNSFKVM